MCTKDSLPRDLSLPAMASPRAKKKKRDVKVRFAQANPPERNAFSNKSSMKEAVCLHRMRARYWDQVEPPTERLEPTDDSLVAVSDIPKKRRIEGMHHGGHQVKKGLLVNRHSLADDSHVAIAFVASLKACAKLKDLRRGIDLHRKVDKEGLLQTNVFVGSSLVNMYARCGAMEKAQETFNMLPKHNVVSWNTLITGYARNGYGNEALKCFEQMQCEGVVPDAVTFTCTLKACGSIKNIQKGEEIHTQIMRERLLEKDIVVANAVIDMYAKCGSLQKAKEVFDQLPVRDIISWTTLITGYVQHDHGEEALSCYEQMQLRGFHPDGVTFASVLKACSSTRALGKGEEIHAQIQRDHSLDKDVVIGNALVDMYVKCGALDKAQEVFDGLCVQNLISWNALITGYAQHGYGEKALLCFEKMQREGFSPDAVTFASALKACGSLGALEKGQKIHLGIVKERLLEKDIVVAGAVVDMYAKCGNLEKAQEVFDELPVRDIITWTSLIAGYTENGFGEEALRCLGQMQMAGLSPNAVTYACVLKACGSIRALGRGEDIHAQIMERHNDLDKDTVVGTALVDMYSKCGAFWKAQDVFDSMSMLDEASWNALIAGYTDHGLGNEALNCFQQMQLEGFQPDATTFMYVLKACGCMGTASMGLKAHVVLVKLGLLDEVEVLGTLLVVMYANCGMLLEAEKVFRKLAVCDVVSWSVLMQGYAQIGKDENVVNLFDEMKQEGLVPTSVTLTVVLNACSHRGLVQEGQRYFEILSKAYGILPTLEHHSCMVDLFGRVGQLEIAVAVIENMPVLPDLAMWHTLLSACKKSVNKEIGKLAFEHAVHLNEIDDAAYVSMGNIYAASVGRLIQAN